MLKRFILVLIFRIIIVIILEVREIAVEHLPVHIPDIRIQVQGMRTDVLEGVYPTDYPKRYYVTGYYSVAVCQ